jgi:hypothetical protein
MADQHGATTGAIKPGGSAPGRSPIVFVSDASAEAERITDMLRRAGYVVADVAVSLLAARVSAQRPDVLLLDADAEGALGEIAKVRRISGMGAIDFIYFGSGDGIVKNADDAFANYGSAFFLRPVDVGGLVRKIEALTGGPAASREVRTSSPPPPPPPPPPSPPPPSPPPPPPSPPPPSRGPASSRRIPSSDRPSPPSLPAPGLRTPGPPLPMSTSSLADLVDPPRSLASFGTVSNELQQLLADAELRAEVMSSPDVAMPSPDEEIEAVLPADVLASLDEPLDGDDEDEEPGAFENPRTGSSLHDREGTGDHARGTTAGGTRQATTGSHVRGAGASASAPAPAVPITRAPTSRGASRDGRADRVDTTPAELGRRGSSSSEQAPAAEVATHPSSWHPPPAVASPRHQERSATRLEREREDAVSNVSEDRQAPVAVVVGSVEARRFFAEAVGRRATGALCFESDGVVRRIVLREGDLVAAASAGEQETLVHFLAARGELPRDETPRLATKIPPYGRHAGAALVAHGWLRQDQLWQVLRAHAEWIASAVLRIRQGTVQLEPDPPGRLRGEPSVFGASTGAEIFVELVRRGVPVADALENLGGETSRVTDGPNHELLAECNLSAQDLELLHRARGGSISDLLARAPDGEIVAVVHALALLGIVEVVPAPDFRGHEGRSLPDAEVEALDEEAIRARVRARLELVEEGDYFAVLGVARDATGYEIRRAFVELRRTFEPSRILTPRLLDLADDARKIVVVLEEAYEILRDNARRERYRRAIDARPD